MNTLLAVEGILVPCCSKTNITYTFPIHAESDRLDIYFSYRPKILEDLELSKELIVEGIEKFGGRAKGSYLDDWKSFLPLNNLLTISVDDYEKFRGSAHRHNPEQHHFIKKDDASSGFIPGPIGKGQWRVTISIHAVVTNQCKYTLKVCEGNNDD